MKPAESKQRSKQLRQSIDDNETLAVSLRQLTTIMKEQQNTIDQLRERCAVLDEQVTKLDARCREMVAANMTLRDKLDAQRRELDHAFAGGL